jgi:hypothetical protein
MYSKNKLAVSDNGKSVLLVLSWLGSKLCSRAYPLTRVRSHPARNLSISLYSIISFHSLALLVEINKRSSDTPASFVTKSWYLYVYVWR